MQPVTSIRDENDDNLKRLLRAIAKAKTVFVCVDGKYGTVDARITKTEAEGLAAHIVTSGVNWYEASDRDELWIGMKAEITGEKVMTTTTKRIADYVQKPSQAIRYMIDGLQAQSIRPDFVISMGTFLSTSHNLSSKRVCCGCAATCAIQQIAGVNITIKQYEEHFAHCGNLWDKLSAMTGFDREDVRSFEDALDWVRCGEVETLFEWCGIETPRKYRGAQVTPEMTTENWPAVVSRLEAFASELERSGY